MDLENKQLGTYRLVSRIGRGGMAEVWLANQTTLNREVAVKIINDAGSNGDEYDQDLAKRFEREAYSAARLDHPGILSVIDYGNANGYLYLVMPYVRGGSLHDLIKKGRMPYPRIFDIFRQMLDALDYAHHHQIVHRDLKPANILIREDGRPVIADFGIAKILNENVNLTHTGMAVGSPEYMAPEQFMGNAEYRSDLYSMGVILYQMLTGQVIYSGSTAIEIAMRHINEAIPLPNPQIPAPLEQFLHKALQKQPEQRYPNATAMIAAFNQAVRAITGEIPTGYQAQPVDSTISISSITPQTPSSGGFSANSPSQVSYPMMPGTPPQSYPGIPNTPPVSPYPFASGPHTPQPSPYPFSPAPGTPQPSPYPPQVYPYNSYSNSGVNQPSLSVATPPSGVAVQQPTTTAKPRSKFPLPLLIGSVAIVLILLIGGVAIILGVNNTTQSQPTVAPTEASVSSGQSLTILLSPMAGSGVSGKAVITDNGNDQITVVLSGTGLTSGEHFAHIHTGTCQQQGPIKYPLNSLTAKADGSGTSTTVVKVKFSEVTNGSFYINIHGVAGVAGAVASCGQITS